MARELRRAIYSHPPSILPTQLNPMRAEGKVSEPQQLKESVLLGLSMTSTPSRSSSVFVPPGVVAQATTAFSMTTREPGGAVNLLGLSGGGGGMSPRWFALAPAPAPAPPTRFLLLPPLPPPPPLPSLPPTPPPPSPTRLEDEKNLPFRDFAFFLAIRSAAAKWCAGGT